VSETPVFLVRHAKAGSRSSWTGPDRDRPLSKAGRRQADGLVTLLGDTDIARVVTSPYLRCHQTVAPLSARLAVPVEVSDLLVEGTMLRDALRVVEKMSDRATVLCTHGDVIGELLEHLERVGVLTGEPQLEKGSTWVLGTDAGDVLSARYLPPPI